MRSSARRSPPPIQQATTSASSARLRRASGGDTRRHQMSERLVDIAMPKLSDSMEEAVIVRWLKRVGESVRKGDPLIEVETDKATVVYEAESSGRLQEIVAGDGSSAELGVVIARLLVADATAAA